METRSGQSIRSFLSADKKKPLAATIKLILFSVFSLIPCCIYSPVVKSNRSQHQRMSGIKQLCRDRNLRSTCDISCFRRIMQQKIQSYFPCGNSLDILQLCIYILQHNHLAFHVIRLFLSSVNAHFHECRMKLSVSFKILYQKL